jgi:hypothetical protein
MLIPRELDMVEAGKHMPLPLFKPKIEEIEAKKGGSKDKAKDNTETAKTEQRAGKRMRHQASPLRWRFRL